MYSSFENTTYIDTFFQKFYVIITILVRTKYIMMKKHILLASASLCLLLACTPKDTSQPTPKISDKEITSVANDFFVALGTGDSTLMNRLLSQDFKMFEHDVIWNADSLLSLMPNTLGREWSVVDPIIQAEGDLAHLYYFNQGILPSDRSWYESMLIERTKDGLKIKFMHSTKLYLK